MMQFRMQLLYKLTLGVICILWTQQAQAELMRDENSLNSLYDNLLQREYPGPVVFPNHQVERKAQRSPSLRLRFGRRSDPELMQDLPQKRWFGEVNQKPIRSPSLRLRFGRRSDPNMPMHSPFDILMNSQQQQQQDQQAFSSPAENMDDYNDLYGNYYDRIIRKPQRLRFGRSLPFSSNNNNGGLMNNHENNLQNIEDDTDNEDMNEMTLGNSQDDFYNSLLHSQKLKQLLLTLRQFENLENQGEPGSLVHFDENNFEAGDINQFERAIRKPGPLRLRFGRSANNLQRQSMLTDLAEQSNERIAKQAQKEQQQQQQQHQEEKKTLNDVSNSVDKTQNQQDKD